VFAFAEHEDAIGDLFVDVARNTLLSASCDGTLGVYDLRRAGKLLARTAQCDDELLSVCVIKEGAAVVVGTQGGALQVWRWGSWAAAEDGAGASPEKFVGHPESIDAMLKVDEDTIVTGSSDGIVRLLTVRPNKLVGVLAQHGDFPVERLAWSRDRKLLGSVSHDMAVKLWDVSYLDEDEDDEDEGGGGAEGAGAAEAKRGVGAGAGAAASSSSSSARAPSKFTRFTALDLAATVADAPAGEDEDEVEDEDDDDEEDMHDDGPPRKKKSLGPGGKGGGGGGGGFFSDM
jgi:hypothetical protein